MSNWGTLHITDRGQEAVLELMAGNMPIVFTKFKLGKGEPPEDTAGLFDLVDGVKNIPITSFRADGNRFMIASRINNMGLYEGFSCNELGLYLQDKDGTEIMYGYMTDTHPHYLPAENIRIVDVPISITLIMSETANITANINLDGYASVQDLQDVKETSLHIEQVYPVGAIYLSTVATDPAELFEGTLWQKLPSGRMLLAEGDGYEAGTMGGSATHKMTVDEMPAHTHDMGENGSHRHWSSGAFPNNLHFDACSGNGASSMAIGVGDGCWGGHQYDGHTSTDGSHKHPISVAGKGKEFSTMSPYLSVYMWQRIS